MKVSLEIQVAEKRLRLDNLELSAGTCTILLVPGSPIRSELARELCAHGSVVAAKDGTHRAAVYVPSEYSRYLTEATVREELLAALEIDGLDRREAERRSAAWLSVLRIEHLLDRNPITLSGGELQRLAIAIGLTREPTLLVLEEPYADLDSISRDIVEEILVAELPALGVSTCVIGAIVTNRALRSCVLWAQVSTELLPMNVEDDRLTALMRAPDGYVLNLNETTRDGTPIASPSPPLSPLVDLRQLTFNYPRRKRPALANLSLVLSRGRCVALTGNNGAGKSTLVSLVLGFETGYKGTVFLSGTRASRATIEQLRAGVGVLFQSNHQYFFGATAREELSEALLFRDCQPNRVFPYPAIALDEIADRFELASYLDAPVDSLALQQRRLLGAATAILWASSLLVLDEPTAGLDRIGRNIVAREIRRLYAANLAILVVSHDRSFLAEVCDWEVTLDDGHLAYAGPFRGADHP